jgi:L-threonylcarbamoyladenylate synthase
VDRAVDCVRRGALLAYPTETVWGLGADAGSDAALERLRAFKGRADDAPVSILVAEPAAIAAPDFDASPLARALAERFWPGPLTLVLPCRRRFAAGVAREDGAVGVPRPGASPARWSEPASGRLRRPA